MEVRTACPGVLKFGPGQAAENDGMAGNKLDDLVEKAQRESICPLQVVKDEQERFFRLRSMIPVAYRQSPQVGPAKS